MYRMGDKIKFFDSDAIVLATTENEVLIFINQHCIKWVESTLLQLAQQSA